MEKPEAGERETIQVVSYVQKRPEADASQLQVVNHIDQTKAATS